MFKLITNSGVLCTHYRLFVDACGGEASSVVNSVSAMLRDNLQADRFSGRMYRVDQKSKLLYCGL